uniref:DENN domain-containing protein 11 n=1 Tax=Pyxicephalus adspersus TaxID=30357 RepID=A0AAV3AGD3_PYXAD|nr:TPA: hypothetical protein GDO54_006399 [Pyxicephalus adspersus]
MAGRTDRAPLLDWAEGPGVSPTPEVEQGDKWPKKYGASWKRLPPGELSPLPQLEDDRIVAVFVVTFDPRSGNSSSPPDIFRPLTSFSKITHPAGCMSQFIKFFGEQIFVLWKFALLRKRILIFSPPPVGVVCYRVYCCCCLANVTLPGVGATAPESKPFFYVNVADIETLDDEVSYVACEQLLMYTQEVDGDCSSCEEDLFIL